MFIRNERFNDFIRFYPVVTIIVAIQLLLWLFGILSPSFGNLIQQYGAGVNLLIDRGEYWRLLTPIFLHSPYGVMHVLFNSFSLVLFGPALEQMLGKFRFIFTYFLSGIIGNFFTYLFDPSAFFIHVGASGAIYGLFGVYLYMVFFRKRLIDPASSQIVTTIFIIGIIMTFLRPGINIFAHIFGFIGGLALAPIMLRKANPFSPWRNKRREREDGMKFDPNRWNKRQFSWKNVLWIIFGVLVVLGAIGRLM